MTARCASATNPMAPDTASVIPARHGRPTSRSWGHRLEAYRGSFGPVKDLNTKIRAFSDGWNDRCHPFVWTKTAEQILKKANRQTTSNRSTPSSDGSSRVLSGSGDACTRAPT